MKQWLSENIAQDNKDLLLKEKDLERFAQDYEDEFERQIRPIVDRIRTDGEYVANDMQNERLLDDVEDMAEYVHNRQVDALSSAVILTLVTRARNANGLLMPNKSFNFDPAPLVAPFLREIEQKLRQASRDAVDRIGSFVTQVKNERTSKAVLSKNIFSKVNIVKSFTNFVSVNALYEVDRIIRQEQAKIGGFEWMLYVGPDDSVTRDWCADHVDKVARTVYWETTENDVGPQPPLVYGGGYNCRHRLIPIELSWITTEEFVWGEKQYAEGLL